MCVLHVRCVCMLADNGIGDKGAERLAAALEKNSSLTELYLGGECHGMQLFAIKCLIARFHPC